MARKEFLANLAGIGAALILIGTATGFAVAADRSSAPPPPPAAAHAGPEHGPGPMGPGLWEPRMMGHLAAKLGLTAEQKAAIHKAFEEARPGLEALHKQTRADFALLAKTRPDDAAYQGVVANASQSASQNAAQFVLKSSQLRSRIFGVLTPAQKDQLVKLEAEHRGAWAEHRGPRGDEHHWCHGHHSHHGYEGHEGHDG